MPETHDHDAIGRSPGDRLSDRLSELAASEAGRARLAGPERLRRTAVHRSRTATAAVAAAALVIVGGGWALVGTAGDESSGPQVVTPDPDAPIDPDAPTDPDGGQTIEWTTAIPDDLRLPHEGAPGLESGRWRDVSGRTDTWFLAPCLDPDDPFVGLPATDDAGRTDWRALRDTPPESVYVEQFALYEDDATAAGALEQLGAAVQECSVQSYPNTQGFGGRSTYTWSNEEPAFDSDLVDDALVVWSDYEEVDAQGNPAYPMGGQFVTVVRVGNAVFLTGSDVFHSLWEAPGAATNERDRVADEVRGFVQGLDRFSASPAR